MIQTLRNTITTAILWIAVALVAGYLYSHAPSFAEPLRDKLENAANVR